MEITQHFTLVNTMNAPDVGPLPPLSPNRSFAFFWLSLLLSGLALEMISTAVAWQMYEQTGRASDLGLIGLAQFMPALSLALPSGHLADKLDRRLLVMCAEALACLVAIGLAVASVQTAGVRALLLGLVSLNGVASALRRPALHSLVPGLVLPGHLPKALASTSVADEVAAIAGPMMGGLLYMLGASIVYGASALLLSCSVLLLTAVKYTRPCIKQSSATSTDVLAGVRFVWKSPALLGLISLDMFAVLLGGATALLPIFAKDILHAGPFGLGILRVAPSVGAIIVGVWLSRHPPDKRVGALMFASVAGFGLSTAIFGLSRSLWLSAASLMALGGFDMVSVVIRGVLLQLETPESMRGRVAAVNGIFISTSNQLGAFESGMLAAFIGAAPAVVAGGLGTLIVAALWARLFPSLLRRASLKQDGKDATSIHLT